MTKKDRKIKVPDAPTRNVMKERNVSDDLPPLHTLSISVGHKNSGKTLSIINLLRMYKEEDAVDMVILISPTYESNFKLFQDINDKVYHVFDPIEDPSSARKARDIVKQEADNWVKYKKELRMYEEFKKKVITDDINEEDIDMINTFWSSQHQDFIKPEHWLGRKPVIHIVFDDIVGTPLMNKNLQSLNNFCLLHRHVGPLYPEEDGALGCSLYFMTQSYKSKSGTIPKSIRENASMLMVFWTYNQEMLESIALESAGNVSYDDFFKYYKKAFDTDEEPRHSFLLIDFKNSLFKRRFEEIL